MRSKICGAAALQFPEANNRVASFSRNKQKSEVGFGGIEEGSIILPYPASIHERENSQKQNFSSFFWVACRERKNGGWVKWAKICV